MTKPLPYPKRVLLMALRTLTSWPRNVPRASLHLLFGFIDFVVPLLSFLFSLVLPFTFLLAPLYLWLVDSAAAKRVQQEAEFQKWYGNEMRKQSEQARGE